MIFFRSSAIVSTILATTPCAAALVLDDFSVGAVDAVGNSEDQVLITQSGLDPNHVIGGARRLVFFGAPGTRIVLDTALRQALAPHGTTGGVRFYYGSVGNPLNLDLTADGSTEFRATISGLSIDQLGFSRIQLTDRASGFERIRFASMRNRLVQSGDDILLRLPFSDFNSDLTSVESIGFEFNRIVSMTPFALSALTSSAIPEPSALAIMASCVSGIVALRRLTRRGAVVCRPFRASVKYDGRYPGLRPGLS